MTTLNLHIAADNDCLFRRWTGAAWALSQAAGYLTMGDDGVSTKKGFAARLTGVNIPQGSKITAAYLTMYGYANYANDSCKVYLAADDADNSAQLAANEAAWEARTQTTAKLDWTVAHILNNTAFDSPSIVAVIQEIVDRSGWVSGNAITLMVNDDDARSTASAYRVSRDRAGGIAENPDQDPILHIEFTESSQAFKISAAAAAHSNYGLAYPVTYKFEIPAGSSGLKCYVRKVATGTLTRLTEKTATDFFNGIECVRFDYTNNYAYVSVAFGSTTDDIYVVFVTASGGRPAVFFSTITAYYDNRVAVVTSTWDDFTAFSSVAAGFGNGITQYAARNIPAGIGVITGAMDAGGWTALQGFIDNGNNLVEINNHSATHDQTPPYADYDAEITGSRTAILANLTLPPFYRSGATQYMPVWSQPGGAEDATIRTKLGEAYYLADRKSDGGMTTWTTWDAANGLYNATSVTANARIETDTEADIKTAFDTAYAAGNIFHMMAHATSVDWSDGEKAQNVLDYIANKLDIWYVNFGAMFMYHYAQERGDVTAALYAWAGDGIPKQQSGSLAAKLLAAGVI